MRFPTISLVTAAVLLAGCATPPAKVQALQVSTAEYDDMNCRQLRTVKSTWEQNVAALSEQQQKARTGDTIGVILIGIPTGSLSGGDVETQLAQAKGHLNAVNSVLIRKSC
ncbi:MAG: hypothetical protein AAF429_04985 [Pseudomonadota bacterium]